jgi:hypothetical protein
MPKRRFFGHMTLAVASTAAIAACSSSTPTSPEAAALSLAAAPTIGVQKSIVWALLGLCYPAVVASTRGCPSAGSLSIKQYWGWDPQLDGHQERDLDQAIPEHRNRAVHHEGLG